MRFFLCFSLICCGKQDGKCKVRVSVFVLREGKKSVESFVSASWRKRKRGFIAVCERLEANLVWKFYFFLSLLQYNLSISFKTDCRTISGLHIFHHQHHKRKGIAELCRKLNNKKKYRKNKRKKDGKTYNGINLIPISNKQAKVDDEKVEMARLFHL